MQQRFHFRCFFHDGLHTTLDDCSAVFELQTSVVVSTGSNLQRMVPVAVSLRLCSSQSYLVTALLCRQTPACLLTVRAHIEEVGV